MTVKIRDRGWKKIKKELTTNRKKHVAVGILGEDANEAYEGEDVTTAQVATWNHYGTLTIPARPFLSGPVTEKEEEIHAFIRRLQTGVHTLKITQDEALKLLGEKVRSIILAKINDEFPPPNADSTIAKKGSSKPLIDTGQLKGSITYEVRQG